MSFLLALTAILAVSFLLLKLERYICFKVLQNVYRANRGLTRQVSSLKEQVNRWKESYEKLISQLSHAIIENHFRDDLSITQIHVHYDGMIHLTFGNDELTKSISLPLPDVKTKGSFFSPKFFILLDAAHCEWKKELL